METQHEDSKSQQNSFEKLENKIVHNDLQMLAEYNFEKVVGFKVDENGEKLYKIQCIGYRWLNENHSTAIKQLIEQFNNNSIPRKRGRPCGKRKKSLQINQASQVAKCQNVNGEKLKAVFGEVSSNIHARIQSQDQSESVNETEYANEDGEETHGRRSKRLKRKKDDGNSTGFVCSTCGKSYRNEGIFLSHLLDHEEDALSSKSKLTKELFVISRSDDGQKTFKCRLCEETFVDKKLVKIHYEFHDVNNPWYCKVCRKHFLSEAEFTDHNKIHNNQKFEQCSNCEKYICADNLQLHKQIYCKRTSASFAPSFKCRFCTFSCEDNKSLQSHLSSEHEVTCKICKCVFTSKLQLDKHISSQHAKNTQYEMCDTPSYNPGEPSEHIETDIETVFKCTKCFETFSLSEDLEMHYRMSEECLDTVCTECNVSFANIGELSIHLQSIAQTSVEEGGTVILYLCGFCHRGFHLESSYLEHTDLHLSELNKPCLHCHEIFSGLDELISHVRGDHKLPVMLPCVECRLTFDNDALLNKHVKSEHSRDFVFRCLICESEFESRVHLRQHVLSKAHKNNLYKEMFFTKNESAFGKSKVLNCGICGRVFHSAPELKRHSMQHERVEIKLPEDLAKDEQERINRTRHQSHEQAKQNLQQIDIYLSEQTKHMADEVDVRVLSDRDIQRIHRFLPEQMKQRGEGNTLITKQSMREDHDIDIQVDRVFKHDKRNVQEADKPVAKQSKKHTQNADTLAAKQSEQDVLIEMSLAKQSKGDCQEIDTEPSKGKNKNVDELDMQMYAKERENFLQHEIQRIDMYSAQIDDNDMRTIREIEVNVQGGEVINDELLQHLCSQFSIDKHGNITPVANATIQDEKQLGDKLVIDQSFSNTSKENIPKKKDVIIKNFSVAPSVEKRLQKSMENILHTDSLVKTQNIPSVDKSALKGNANSVRANSSNMSSGLKDKITMDCEHRPMKSAHPIDNTTSSERLSASTTSSKRPSASLTSSECSHAGKTNQESQHMAMSSLREHMSMSTASYEHSHAGGMGNKRHQSSKPTRERGNANATSSELQHPSSIAIQTDSTNSNISSSRGNSITLLAKASDELQNILLRMLDQRNLNNASSNSTQVEHVTANADGVSSDMIEVALYTSAPTDASQVLLLQNNSVLEHQQQQRQ